MKLSNAAINMPRTARWRKLEPMPYGARTLHGCCKIDTHRMIIVGGEDASGNFISSGAIFDVRTEQWTPLPNDMPKVRAHCSVVAKGKHVYVIGGVNADRNIVTTVYRLSLETNQWATMAPMGTERANVSAVLQGDYIYVHGGDSRNNELASAERYSIIRNSWEPLPDMAEARFGHCAVTAPDSAICLIQHHLIGKEKGILLTCLRVGVMQLW